MATIAVVSSPDLKKYFENELGVDLAINGGSKMNPSTNDFLEAIEQVDAETIFIMPNNSNVYLTAKQAATEEAIKNIISINITKAAKDSVVDGVKIKKDQQMIIVDGKITGVAPTMNILFEKQVSKQHNK
ncbi:hypothetical protein FQA39_LY12939 [Lamprigera yunnana]|nr:hypothetical protein FQA39_LY12939 [Lamprigera yunnana]